VEIAAFKLSQMYKINKIMSQIRSNREKFSYTLALPLILGYNNCILNIRHAHFDLADKTIINNYKLLV